MSRVVVFVDADRSPSITCHTCGAKSYHPRDISDCYCGRCHRFHANLTDFTIEIPKDPMAPEVPE